MLKEAIKAFDGTAIIVSHDRDFLDGLVSKVYEFGGGQVKEHIGGIYDYLRAHNAETIHEALNGKAAAEEKTAAAATTVSATPQVQSPAKGGAAQSGASQPATKESWEKHKEKQKKLRKAQRAVEESEAKIAKMEARLKELDALLMDPKNAANMQLVNEYSTTQEALDKENDRWMELSEKVEELG